MRTMTKEQIRKAKARYDQQKYQAAYRGIEWKLTFDEWITWWMNTGLYHARGCGRGKYVMSRKGDQGAYAIGNIEVKLHSENVSESAKRARPSRTISIYGSKNPKAKKIRIHGQIYDCIRDASRAIGINYSTLQTRLRNNKRGYEYL